MASSTAAGGTGTQAHLRREVGFWGLMFVSLGSIIGSGWLLGALTAAKVAGGASLLAWILAAFMLGLLALVHAELGGAYPIAGGTARFPHFAFGPLAGFAAGWMGWLQAVTIAPIEVLATLSYVAHIDWVKNDVTILHTDGTLTHAGLVIATLFMLLFTFINIVGVKWLARVNNVAVVWKTAVPLLTIVVLLLTRFNSSNFTAGGGFMPYGTHGVFSALPAGVVFALEGFEQAIQMAGEAKKPQQDVSRAVLIAMAIGTIVYLLLEVAFIGALDPKDIAHGWANPVGVGDFGPYATLAILAGAGWLASILYIDAVISPAGTGLIYLATSARLSYALGRQRNLWGFLARIDSRGIPIVSLILAFIFGELAFLPFPSWTALVGLVTSATAIMYAFAPVSLHALRKSDPDRERPYKVGGWQVVAPLAFISANLIIYWGGWEATWKLSVMMVAGLILFAITRAGLPAEERVPLDWRSSVWIWPWLIGMLIINRYGRYGTYNLNKIPNNWDSLVVIVWSLIIYYWAVNDGAPQEDVLASVRADQDEISAAPELNIAG
jgi:amino acid transporter